MKRALLSSAWLLILPLTAQTATPAVDPVDPSLHPLIESVTKVRAEPWRAVERRAHETVWQSVKVISNRIDGSVQFQTNAFTEIGGGLNAVNAAGEYVTADLSFDITENGAEAIRAAHRLTLSANIAAGSILAEFPDGTRLETRPMAFSYFDPVDGRFG